VTSNKYLATLFYEAAAPYYAPQTGVGDTISANDPLKWFGVWLCGLRRMRRIKGLCGGNTKIDANDSSDKC
jgi:hypothetical protein